MAFMVNYNLHVPIVKNIFTVFIVNLWLLSCCNLCPCLVILCMATGSVALYR